MIPDERAIIWLSNDMRCKEIRPIAFDLLSFKDDRCKMVNNKQSLFFGPNVLGLRGKSTTILEAIMLDAWNFLTLCTNGWSVFCLKIGKMEQFCEDSWKSSGKIPKLETVPKIPNIGLFQVSAPSNGRIMHVTVTFLEIFFYRFTPQVAPKMMV